MKVRDKAVRAAALRQGGRGRQRLARDNAWLAENGVDEDPHDGKSAPGKDGVVLCAYDATRIGIDKTVRVIESHDIIMFEDSQAVYSRR